MNLFAQTSLYFSLLVPGAKAFSATAPATAASSKRKQIVKTEDVPGLKNGMDYVKLGDSDLVVSNICMGTMTFGNQNTLDEGVEQLATAFGEYGVNFLDTAVSISFCSLSTTRIIRRFCLSTYSISFRKCILYRQQLIHRERRIVQLPNFSKLKNEKT